MASPNSKQAANTPKEKIDGCKITVNGQDFDVPELTCQWKRSFPPHGQGTLVFNIVRNDSFLIIVKKRPDPSQSAQTGDNWIGVAVGPKQAALIEMKDGNLSQLESKEGDTVGLDCDKKVAYWLSYDRDNLVVQYGKGYRMDETLILKHDYLKGVPEDKQAEKRAELDVFFNPAYDRIAEMYDTASTSRNAENTNLLDIEGMVEFDYDPFTRNYPYTVLDSSKVTLMDIDNAKPMLSASLPPTCLELYSNIKTCDIDWLENVDQVKLSDAIRYSIITPKMILYEKLKEKAGEFDPAHPDESETYLRVTLGYSDGGSPGIPYVLEIWPKGHYSPIHNHGNSFAVIKVLHGGLTIHVYNKLIEDNTTGTKVPPEQLFQFDVKKDDVTWIAPRWFQVHKLWNESDDYCATIQCYKFGKIDTTHWPYFDYYQDQNQIAEFLPNSDFTFREMRDQVLAEYKASLTTA